MNIVIYARYSSHSQTEQSIDGQLQTCREEYLLITELFCGYCREMMTGYGGTEKLGKAYHYYACNGMKKNARKNRQ